MLSKNDKKWLKEAIESEIKSALTVKCKFERKRDPKTGQPLAVPEIEVRDVYLPAHWIELQPFLEAALRGVQETADKAKNNAAKSADATAAIAGILLGMEAPIKSIGQLTAVLNKRIEQGPVKGFLEDGAGNVIDAGADKKND